MDASLRLQLVSVPNSNKLLLPHMFVLLLTYYVDGPKCFFNNHNVTSFSGLVYFFIVSSIIAYRNCAGCSNCELSAVHFEPTLLLHTPYFLTLFNRALDLNQAYIPRHKQRDVRTA
jgi:hypothetical protein